MNLFNKITICKKIDRCNFCILNLYIYINLSFNLDVVSVDEMLGRPSVGRRNVV